MKNVLLLAVVFLLPFCSNAQDHIDKITETTCDCINEIDKDMDTEQYTLEIGLCMMAASEPYAKALKKKNDIDITSGDAEAYEKLGMLIGVKLASKCPEVLKMFVENPELLDELDDDEVETLFVEGEITDINTDNFVVFTLEEENSVQKKYYWFSSVKADLNIVSEYKSLLNKRVILYYQPEEFFDPKIDEYRIFNKIVEIEQ